MTCSGPPSEIRFVCSKKKKKKMNSNIYKINSNIYIYISIYLKTLMTCSGPPSEIRSYVQRTLDDEEDDDSQHRNDAEYTISVISKMKSTAIEQAAEDLSVSSVSLGK